MLEKKDPRTPSDTRRKPIEKRPSPSVRPEPQASPRAFQGCQLQCPPTPPTSPTSSPQLRPAPDSERRNAPPLPLRQLPVQDRARRHALSSWLAVQEKRLLVCAPKPRRREPPWRQPAQSMPGRYQLHAGRLRVCPSQPGASVLCGGGRTVFEPGAQPPRGWRLVRAACQPEQAPRERSAPQRSKHGSTARSGRTPGSGSPQRPRRASRHLRKAKTASGGPRHLCIRTQCAARTAGRAPGRRGGGGGADGARGARRAAAQRVAGDA